jgi:hypothetical protein
VKRAAVPTVAATTRIAAAAATDGRKEIERAMREPAMTIFPFVCTKLFVFRSSGGRADRQ